MPRLTGATTHSSNHIAALTGLRGVAALLVFAFHYGFLHPGVEFRLTLPGLGDYLVYPSAFGFAGVDVFFVLSGFLLTLPFARFSLGQGQKPSLRRYFRRRLLRVLPAYYTQLFIILALGSWFSTWTDLDASALLAHLLMFFNIGPDPVTPMVGVWWTLPVEMGFYLLLPLLVPLLRPRWWLPLVLLGILLSVTYRGWAADHFAASQADFVFLAVAQLPGSLPEFMLGASAALLAQAVDLGKVQRPSRWMIEVGFLLGLLLPVLWLQFALLGAGDRYWSGHWSMLLGPTALGLCLSLAVVCLYWGSRLGAVLLANRVVWFMGLISYSLYLWHFVVMAQLMKVVGDSYATWPHWVTFPVSLTLVTAVAAVSYYLVERPFLANPPSRASLAP